MTDSLDARTPSAAVHALSGSSAGAGRPFAPLATVHEMPDTFVPLDAAAADVVVGLAARRAAAAHPDAEVIDLAGRVKGLLAREDRPLLRCIKLEDAVFDTMRATPLPREADGVLDQSFQHSVEGDGTRVTVIREPAGWAAEKRANREAHEAALAARERQSEEQEARRGLPRLRKLRDRANDRLWRWGLRLAAMEPVTPAGLAAKAAVSLAVVEEGELRDRWRVTLAISVSRDAVRLAATDAPGLDADLLAMCREAQAQQAIHDDNSLDEAVCDAAGRRSSELEDAAMDAAPPRTMEGAIAYLEWALADHQRYRMQDGPGRGDHLLLALLSGALGVLRPAQFGHDLARAA